MLHVFLASIAFADEPAPPVPPTTPEPIPAAAPESTTTTRKKRAYLMEVNFRGRYMFLPDSVLDIWYEKHAGEPLERPVINAYALGLEYVVRDKQANGIFYAEYISSLLQNGYWDDRDNPPVVSDGSYIVPENLGLIAIGANYGYELHATNWLSFMLGGGLGVGIKTGNLVEWEPGEPEGEPNPNNTDPSCGPDSNAYERANTLDCPDDGQVRVPGVVPILDVNVGIRFNFSDRASLRLEGGVHDLIYGGAALGITF